MPPKLTVLHLENQTIRALPADRLWTTRTTRTVRHKQAVVRKHCATKINFPDGSNHERARTSDKLDKLMASRTVHAYQADCPLGADIVFEPENKK
jgi:hypothetical protein